MTCNGLTVVEKMTKKERDAEAMVQRCLQLLKNRYSFLLYAVDIFKPVAVEERIQPSTDGRRLFFNATEVIKSVKCNKLRDLTEQILHMLLHGIYGDFETEDEEQWRLLHWVAMDFKVERTMNLLGFRGGIEIYLEEARGLLTEPALYLKARNDKKLASKVIRNQCLVKRDNHEYWAKKKKKNTELTAVQLTEQELEELKQKAEIAMRWKEVRAMLFPKSKNGKSREANDITEGFGTGAGVTVEILVEDLINGVRGDRYGNVAGNLHWEVSAEQGKASDYKETLKRLLCHGESTKEEDTIDYNLYLYGLECYGDVPLIEPAELTEKRKMETLALAIDISGSCIDAVPLFLRETIQMLKDARDLVEKGKVYYLECDTEITEKTLYEDFDTAVKRLSRRDVLGGGGTDFRPVFTALEEYIEKGNKVDALFYLSDGMGEFPETPPTYPVYFVMKEEWKNEWEMELPEWVNLILL